MLWAIMRNPAFAAAKWAKPGLPRRLPEAPVKITVPRPRGTSRGAAYGPRKNPPKQPTRQKSSNGSAESSRKSTRRLLPALATTRSAGSRPGPGDIARSKSRTTSASRVVSVGMGSALPPDSVIARATCSIFCGVRRRRARDILPPQSAGRARRRARARRRHRQRSRSAGSQFGPAAGARDQLTQLSGSVHLPYDVAAADEGAIGVELRDRRPVREGFDSLADGWIEKHIDRMDRHIVVAQHVDDGGREAALRVRGIALHEEDNGMSLDGFGDVCLGVVGAAGFRHGGFSSWVVPPAAMAWSLGATRASRWRARCLGRRRCTR